MFRPLLPNRLRPFLPRSASTLPPTAARLHAKRVTVVNLPRGGARWSPWRAPPSAAPAAMRRPFLGVSLELITVASVCAVCFALLRASRDSASAAACKSGEGAVVGPVGRCRSFWLKM